MPGGRGQVRGSARRRSGTARPGRCVGRKPLPQFDRAAARPARAGLQHDEAGQVVRLAADAVGDPRPHARPAELACEPVLTNSLAGAWLKTSVATDRTIARSSTTPAMCGRHSETQAPDSPCWANLRLVPSSFGRLLGERVHEGEPLPLDERLGDRLAVVLLELRLVVEQLELARAAGHEQVDDALRLRREVARPRRQRVRRAARRGAAAAASARRPASERQGHRAEADAAPSRRSGGGSGSSSRVRPASVLVGAMAACSRVTPA